MQRQPQLFGQRIDGRAAAFPGPFGFESQIADPPAPRCDDAANRAEITAIGMLFNTVLNYNDIKTEPARAAGTDAEIRN